MECFFFSNFIRVAKWVQSVGPTHLVRCFWRTGPKFWTHSL